MKTMLCAVMFATAITALAGCGGDSSGSDDLLGGVPDSESLRIKLPGSQNAQSALAAEGGGLTTKSLGDLAEFYTFTRQITWEVNNGVYHLLLMIEDIARQTPTTKETDRWIWGPYTPGGLDPASYKVTIEKKSDTDYAWSFDAKPKDAGDDAFKPWMSGTHTKGQRPRRGAGTIALDFDMMAAIDATKVEKGKADVTYQSDAYPVTVTVKFIDFIGEDGKGPGDATYNYTENEDASGEFSFAILQDMDGKGQDEDARILTRWKGDGVGRSDVKFMGGDLTTQGLTDVVAAECWDAGFKRTYFEDWATIATGTYPVDEKQGEATACPYADQKFPE